MQHNIKKMSFRVDKCLIVFTKMATFLMECGLVFLPSHCASVMSFLIVFPCLLKFTHTPEVSLCFVRKLSTLSF